MTQAAAIDLLNNVTNMSKQRVIGRHGEQWDF
jgi:hypothetical protein